MPRRYRNKNREFKSYAWQLKQVDKSLVTRIIFKGHKLTLEMKQKDLEETKYDWTIVREYSPEPESPTPKSDTSRIRTGLIPSKTIEMVDKNYVSLFQSCIPSGAMANNEHGICRLKQRQVH